MKSVGSLKLTLYHEGVCNASGFDNCCQSMENYQNKVMFYNLSIITSYRRKLSTFDGNYNITTFIDPLNLPVDSFNGIFDIRLSSFVLVFFLPAISPHPFHPFP